MTHTITSKSSTTLAIYNVPDPAILAGSLTESTIRQYSRAIKLYYEWAKGRDLDPRKPSTLQRWVTHMAQETKLSANTINMRVYAVKRIMEELVRQEYVQDQAAQDALAFRAVRGASTKALKTRKRKNARTRLSPVQMRALCEAPKTNTLIGLRDAALLATLASSGMRVTEAATLTVSQLRFDGEHYFAEVQGKTDVEPREVPLSPAAVLLITCWLLVRPTASPYLFNAFTKGNKELTASPIDGVAAWKRVKRYATRVGLKDVKPHDIRRYVGTQLVKHHGVSVARRVLGHKNYRTTDENYNLEGMQRGVTDDLV